MFFSHPTVRKIAKQIKRVWIGRVFIDAINSVRTFVNYRFVSDKKFIEKKFKMTFGRELDLSNPQTLNEKIQWLKLYDRTPLHTLCADKYKVREYVKEKIGKEYLVQFILETKNPKDINPSNLPDYPFVIKVTHDSSGVFIIRDKTKEDWKSIQKQLAKLLRSDYYKRKREWQYKNIEPRIIVEKLLIDKNGQLPNDYKIHCFNGKVEIIQVDLDRFSNHKRVLYDKNWRFLDFEWGYPMGSPVAPNQLSVRELNDVSSKLSEPFCYSRIDFYLLGNKIYFGEITFHPGSGFEIFSPTEYDMKYGVKLQLSKAIENE